MEDAQFEPGDVDGRSWDDGFIGLVVGVDDVPQHTVGGVQRDGRVGDIGKGDGRVDVVVVAVGANDFPNAASVDCVDDWQVIVRWIEDYYFFVVPNDPNVVGDFEILTVKGEDAVGGNQFNAHAKGLAHLEPPKERK